MDKLHLKYLDNTLSLDELKKLRLQVENTKDEEIEQILLDSWLSSAKLGNEGAHTVFIEPKKRGRFVFLNRMLRVAASFLLPILAVTTIYFYNEANQSLQDDMVIRVAKGESVALTLPDGSHLNLNSESVLRYNPASFNTDKRELYFEGEGYFDVAHNKDLPFVLTTADVKVEVLGTEFNFLSHNHLDNIELTLIDGHVVLTCLDSLSTQKLYKNQKALFSRSANTFTLIPEVNAKASISWIKGELIYTSAMMKQVLESLERHFEMDLCFENCDDILNEKFTATLPSNDLNEAVEIIQRVFDLRHVRVDKKIIFYHK